MVLFDLLFVLQIVSAKDFLPSSTNLSTTFQSHLINKIWTASWFSSISQSTSSKAPPLTSQNPFTNLQQYPNPSTSIQNWIKLFFVLVFACQTNPNRPVERINRVNHILDITIRAHMCQWRARFMNTSRACKHKHIQKVTHRCLSNVGARHERFNPTVFTLVALVIGFALRCHR